MTKQSSQMTPAAGGTARYGVPGAPPQSPIPAADDEATGQTAGAQKLLDFLANRKDKDGKPKKGGDLTDAEKALLGKMIAQGTGNTFKVFDETGKQVASVDPGGVDYEFRKSDKPEDVAHNVDCCIKSSLVYKASFGNEVFINGRTDLENMMLAKSAALAGVTVKNPPSQTLEQVNPQLAKQMDDWAVAHGMTPRTAEKYDNKPATAGLITTPSTLDTAPPAGQHFAAAVTPPAVAAPTAPAPAVAPKQALT